MTKEISMIVLLLCIFFSGISVIAQDVVNVDIDDIPSGQQITITYSVLVNQNLPQGLLFIQNQGRVTGSNFDAILSDDPQTTLENDSTNTPVGFTLNVAQLPNTGELPWTRHILLSALVAMLICIISFGVMKRFTF